MEMKAGQIEDDGCPCWPQSEAGCSVLSQKSFLPSIYLFKSTLPTGTESLFHFAVCPALSFVFARPLTTNRSPNENKTAVNCANSAFTECLFQLIQGGDCGLPYWCCNTMHEYRLLEAMTLKFRMNA